MLTNTFSYKKPLSHAPTPEQAHRGCRLMTLALIYDDKVKNARRIAPYSVLSQFYPIFAYREACASLLCSYRGGSLSHAPTPEQARRGCRLMTLAS